MFRALKQLNRDLLLPHGFGPVKEMWIVNHVCSMFRIWAFAIATKEVMKFRPMELSTRYGGENCRSSNHMAEKKKLAQHGLGLGMNLLYNVVQFIVMEWRN